MQIVAKNGILFIEEAWPDQTKLEQSKDVNESLDQQKKVVFTLKKVPADKWNVFLV